MFLEFVRQKTYLSRFHACNIPDKILALIHTFLTFLTDSAVGWKLCSHHIFHKKVSFSIILHFHSGQASAIINLQDFHREACPFYVTD